VIVLLRLIGVLNAATWFGAALFIFVAAPAFFSLEMKRLFGEAYTGIIAQVLLERFFLLQYWCAALALLHQMAEWLYLGKALQRFNLGLLLGITILSLASGAGLQPKLKRLHQIKYGRPELYSAAQKAQAAESFLFWHRLSLAISIIGLGGLGCYVWRVTTPANGPRFVPANKFRS
jgi:hypothetical protein